MSKLHSTGKFALHLTTYVPTDYASIGTGATVVDGTDYTSYVLDVTDVDYVVLQGKATGGNASANGIVDFNILGTLDDVLWDTIAVAAVNVTMAGVAQIVKSDPLDVRGYRSIKLGSIKNNDGSYAATIVNLRWGKSYGHIR